MDEIFTIPYMVSIICKLRSIMARYNDGYTCTGCPFFSIHVDCDEVEKDREKVYEILVKYIRQFYSCDFSICRLPSLESEWTNRLRETISHLEDISLYTQPVS